MKKKYKFLYTYSTHSTKIYNFYTQIIIKMKIFDPGLALGLRWTWSPLESSPPAIKSSSTAALLSYNQIHTQLNSPLETLIEYVVSFISDQSRFVFLIKLLDFFFFWRLYGSIHGIFRWSENNFLFWPLVMSKFFIHHLTIRIILTQY